MSESDPTPVPESLTTWLENARGDASARNEVLRRSESRLRRIIHAVLRDYPDMRRHEDTGSVLSDVMMRMNRAMAEVPLAGSEDFFHLATWHVRNVLRDMARRHRKRIQHHQTPSHNGDHPVPGIEPTTTDGHDRMAGWEEFFNAVEKLPRGEREIFELMWYHDFKRAAVAEILGVDQKTVGRHFLRARESLIRALGGELPF